MTLDVQTLHTLLRLDEATGRLYWRARPTSLFAASPRRPAEHICALWNARYAGTEAFTAVQDHGYLTGAILGRGYKAHRVVFALANGRWPRGYVDHIDGDRRNNRPCNLRDATRVENALNRGALGGASTHCGVHWSRQNNKWQADIHVDGKRKYLGRFVSETEAAKAYDTAARKYHGDFAKLNLPAEEIFA